MHEIGSFDERALLGGIAKSLDASRDVRMENSLGPKRLFPSQGVVLIHYELDQR